MTSIFSDARMSTLFTLAEDDLLASGTQAFFKALGRKKRSFRFTSAQGAGNHRGMGNRSLFNRSLVDRFGEILRTIASRPC